MQFSKPIRILVIGDIHFKVKNFEESELLVHCLDKVAEEKKPDLIVQLGDVLDTFEKIHMDPLNLAFDLFDRLRKHAPLRVLIGNHDRSNNSTYLTKKHPFRGYRADNVTFAWKVLTESVTIDEEEFNLVYCPYVPPGKMKKALKTVEYEKEQCLATFLHQELKKCKVNAFKESESKDKWPEDYPLGVSGHIHDYQRLAENFYYIGACRQVSHGESPDKSISLFTLSGFRKWEEERIYLPIPKKLEFSLKVEEFEDFKVPKKAIVRLTVSGTNSELATLKQGKKYNKLKKMENVTLKLDPMLELEEEDTDREEEEEEQLPTLRELVRRKLKKKLKGGKGKRYEKILRRIFDEE